MALLLRTFVTFVDVLADALFPCDWPHTSKPSSDEPKIEDNSINFFVS